jgi:hypothetical protein
MIQYREEKMAGFVSTWETVIDMMPITGKKVELAGNTLKSIARFGNKEWMEQRIKDAERTVSLLKQLLQETSFAINVVQEGKYLTSTPVKDVKSTYEIVAKLIARLAKEFPE